MIAFSEIGDKTQLLSLVLALRFKKVSPIIAGMVVGFFLNHALAALTGNWLMKLIGEYYLAWILMLTFLIMGILILVPEKEGEKNIKEEDKSKFGPFLTSTIAFFIAEMGDKTQLTTIALAAKYNYLWTVVVGTTVGMLLVNVPVVFLSESIEEKIPMKIIKAVCAAFFILMAIYIFIMDILKLKF
jgi:putative Ca2+/H+ antiporter (TMEM165/GDT1 family)